MIGDYSGSNHQGHEFLKEQLARIGNIDLRDIGLPLAPIAVIRVLCKSSFADETANVTDEDTVLVRYIHGSFLEESGSSMRDHAVALHFTETKASISGSTLSRLSRHNLNRASSSRMHFIRYQML